MGSIGHIVDVLLKYDMNLIIDDFEKTKSLHAKTCVANLAKNLSDVAMSRESPRLVIIGISDSADELIEADLSIALRLHPLNVPRMRDFEMTEILMKGFDALDIEADEEQVSRLCSSLGGFPKYAHAMGLELSRAAFEQDRRKISVDTLRRGIHAFVHRYCAHIKALYNKATVIKGKRNPEYELIVRGLAEIGLYRTFTLEQACKAIDRYKHTETEAEEQPNLKQMRITEERVRTVLNRLTKKERGPMFAKSRRTRTYSYHNPVSPIYLIFGRYLED